MVGENTCRKIHRILIEQTRPILWYMYLHISPAHNAWLYLGYMAYISFYNYAIQSHILFIINYLVFPFKLWFVNTNE